MCEGGGAYLQDSTVLLFNGNVQVSVRGVCVLESAQVLCKSAEWPHLSYNHW